MSLPRYVLVTAFAAGLWHLGANVAFYACNDESPCADAVGRWGTEHPVGRSALTAALAPVVANVIAYPLLRPILDYSLDPNHRTPNTADEPRTWGDFLPVLALVTVVWTLLASLAGAVAYGFVRAVAAVRRIVATR